MQILIDINENVFTRLFDNGTEDYEIVNDDLFAIAKSIRNGTPLKDWLSSFNTDSAPICFNKIQELKRECEKE